MAAGDLPRRPTAAPHPLLERAIAATFGADMPARVSRACALYVTLDGARSFDQCIGLPLTIGKRRNLVRGHWLQIAWAELRATGDDATPAALHAQMVRFIERGSWLRWRDAGGPPPDAAHLHVALWHAVKANGGRDLSCKRIAQLLRNHTGSFHEPALPFIRALGCSAKPGA